MRYLAELLALCLVAMMGCEAAPSARDPGPAAVMATDDVGRDIRLERPARRVLSLLPAGTETFFALGAGDAVVGRTRYDVDSGVVHLPSVGGGLDPSLEAIVALRPDLVVAFETASESRIRPRIEALGIPVFAIQTEDTADIYRNIASLGALVGRGETADSLLSSIRAELSAIRASVSGADRPKVVYVASISPPIVAGPGTYLGELIGVAGGDLLDVGGAQGAYWPQISLETLLREQPDLLVLPVGSDPTSTIGRLRSEPGWRDLEAVKQNRVALVPTDLMSRPGPRIPEIARLLRDAFVRTAGNR